MPLNNNHSLSPLFGPNLKNSKRPVRFTHNHTHTPTTVGQLILRYKSNISILSGESEWLLFNGISVFSSSYIIAGTSYILMMIRCTRSHLAPAYKYFQRRALWREQQQRCVHSFFSPQDIYFFLCLFIKWQICTLTTSLFLHTISPGLIRYINSHMFYLVWI
jgi:hypothetical protein